MSVGETFPPVFATNRVETGETVAAEINRMLRGLREDLASPPELAIATAYLNPAGFDLVADEIEQAPVVRLVLGAEPQAPMWRTVDEASPVDLLDDGLRASRDLTGFTVEADRSARRLVAWLREAEATGKPRVEVRRFNKGFLHGKAFIAIHPTLPAVLAGSSNFTYAGLARNRELNLGYPSGQYTELVIDWFNEQWDDSEPYDLAAFYEARWMPHPPWIVFMRMLHELYGADRDADGRRLELGLTGFQRDGVSRALRILDDLGGVLICDEVGLGKTFIAGEIIHQASIRDRQQVLIVTPAALKDSLWVPFLRRFNLYTNRVQVVSYDDVRLGNRPELQNLDQYALVVIDEAHNLRNPSTQRAKAVEQLLGGEYPKKLVLLTATPVNNGLPDLHTLVSYFVRNDARFASIGIPSIAKYIGHAQAQDPQSLSPEHLFDLMNQVALRRTRHFIKKEYAGETLIGPDGRPQVIEFPTPRMHRVEYELTELGRKLLDAVVYALDDPQADHDPPIALRQRLTDRCADPKRLSMARYMPSLYALDEDLQARQVSSAGLLESILLKRLESSAIALRNTLDKLIASHETFLRALEAGIVLSGRLLEEFAESDDVDEFLEQVDDELLSGVEKAASFDAVALSKRVRLDIELLRELRVLADDAAAVDDPKVEKLLAILEETASESDRPSKDGVSSGDRRKLIVFSTYTDTIVHLRATIVQAIERAPRGSLLAAYRERVTEAIFGSKTGISQGGRAETLAGFAPHTAGLLDEDGTPLSEDRFDLLFATDVLSEGVNLQQAGQIVSVDLPWNPMRLVQRHGRIDRIGSHHRHVDIDCYFPATDLDRLLRLEERLQRKIAYANAAIGMGEVLPGQIADPTVEVTLHDLRQQIEQIHDERTELFEERGGSAALSGEEYRRRLEKATADTRVRAEVLALPYGAGSGFTSSKVNRPGWVFCARIADHAQPWFRFVVADETTWTPYLRPETGDAWIVEDTLSSLVAADPGERETEQHLPEAAAAGVFEAWALAQEYIYRSWSWLTDVANLQPDVPLALREAAELVANHGSHLGVERQRDLVQRLNGRWDKRIVDRVREIVRSEATATERIEELIEFVSEAGLEAPPPPVPLPVIERDDVRLVCWMAVMPAVRAASPTPPATPAA